MRILILAVVNSILLLMLSKPTSQEIECSETLSDYTAHKLIEDAIVLDPEQLFKMRNAFFPTNNDRYWQVDGVQVLPIRVCVSMANSTSHLEHKGEEDINDLEETRRCWSFHWTNSRLFNLISGEILLAMDIVTTKYIYPGILGAVNLQLDLKINQNTSMLGCLLISETMERAVTNLLSWAKLYAMENSPPPTKWESSYQGYIAKSYTYFSTDSYSNNLSRNRWKIRLTEQLLWATFIVINLLIPILFISKGKQLVTCDVKYHFPYRAAATIVTTFNFLYSLVTLGTLFSPTTSGYPSVLDCFIAENKHRCIIPKEAIFYDVSIGILVTKVTILPIAVLIELIVAIYYVRKRRVSSTCRSEFLGVQTIKNVGCFIMRVFTLWQILIFIQIMIGSVSIPFLILLLVSPAQSILLSVELIALIISISGCLLGIPLPSSCKFNVYSCMKLWFSYVENLLVMAVIFLASTTYCLIVKEGISMGSVKGYILSLAPTIPISIFIWMIQERIRSTKRDKRSHRQLTTVLLQKKESFSMDEEIYSGFVN